MFGACRKIDPPEPILWDTLVPGPYFPVYPGSYWDYEIDGQPGHRDSTSSSYVPHQYRTGYIPETYDYAYSDTAYVPIFNGNPIYGYNKIEPPPSSHYNAAGDQLWPFLSETVGACLYSDWADPRYQYGGENMRVVSKDVEAGDSVIIVRGHWNLFNTEQISTRKYVKNVGLISWIVVDTVANDTIFRKELVNYYINH